MGTMASDLKDLKRAWLHVLDALADAIRPVRCISCGELAMDCECEDGPITEMPF